MNQRYFVAGIFLVVAACATPGSVSPEPGANAGSPAQNSKSTTAEGEVEVADTSKILTMADNPRRNEVICRMEKRTGTNRPIRVCRSRSQNAQSAIEAKETFEILRKSQTNNK